MYYAGIKHTHVVILTMFIKYPCSFNLFKFPFETNYRIAQCEPSGHVIED